MELICLILGSMLVSGPYCHDFWVLTSLHLLLFLLKMYYYYFCFHCFFFWMIWIFFGKFRCKLYIIVNHTIISTLIFVHQWRSYQLFMNWLSFSFTYRWCLFSISLTALSFGHIWSSVESVSRQQMVSVVWCTFMALISSCFYIIKKLA